jgi:hypothetical protein
MRGSQQICLFAFLLALAAPSAWLASAPAPFPRPAGKSSAVREEIIFRASYYRTRGPCFRTPDGGWAMPAVDGFELVEVVRGRLKATRIEVRPLSGRAAAYPKDLVEGKVYRLRWTPSAQTRQQLRKAEKEGDRLVLANGDELEEQPTTREHLDASQPGGVKSDW